MGCFGTAKEWAVDCLEQVEVPHTVIIRNIRLGCFLRLLEICAVATFVFLLHDPRASIAIQIPQEMGLQSAWSITDEKAYSKQFTADMEATTCTSPDLLDYEYDPAWRYTNYSCVWLNKADRFWKEGSSAVFAPTAFEETHAEYTTAPGGNSSRCGELSQPCPAGWEAEGPSSCRCEQASHHIVAGAGSLVVGLIHRYSMDVPPSLFRDGQSSGQNSEEECLQGCEGGAPEDEHKRLRQMRTVVTVKASDGSQHVLMDELSPTAINFSLVEVLALSGMGLDTTRTPTIPNRLACGAPGAEGESCRSDLARYPSMRQTGVTLRVELQYANSGLSGSLDIPGSSSRDQDHEGVVCLLQIVATPSWEARTSRTCTGQQAGPGTGSCLSRYFYGVHVKFQATGHFGYFDPVRFGLSCGAALVYLAIPLFFVEKLSLYLLGRLSGIYYKGKRQDVRLTDEVVGYATRALMAHQAYIGLSGGDDKAIHMDAFNNKLKSALTFAKLGDTSLKVVSDLTYAHFDKDESGDLTMEEFVLACINHESLSLQDAVGLLDPSEPGNPLERAFNPHKDVATLADRHHRRSSERASTRSSTLAAFQASGAEAVAQTEASEAGSDQLRRRPMPHCLVDIDNGAKLSL